jgi:hypothetical protein
MQKETLDRFIAGANKLEKLVGFLTEQELDKAAVSGGWTIRQIVHHLSEDGDAWSINIKRAIATPGAFVVPSKFPGNDAWGKALAHDKRSIQGALALFKAHRHIIAEIAACFPDQWGQYITFPSAGEKEINKLSLGQILRMVTDHLDEHRATIEAIKKKYKMQ